MKHRAEKPIKGVGRPTRSECKVVSLRSEGRLERARARYLVVQTIEQFAPAATVAAQQAVVAKAVNAGLLPGLPSSETIRTLRRRWAGGATQMENYMDAPRSGRPSIAPHPDFYEIIKEAVRTGRPSSVRSVHGLIVLAAERLGVPAPSYDTVRRWYAGQGVLRRSAGAHGAEAAELDALPHSTVPAKATHDVWTPDEFQLPVWIRVFLPKEDRWASFKPSVVVLEDYCSRAVVGYHIADPSRREGLKADSRPAIDNDELLAALLSTAMPELAPNACRQYAGSLPRILRWDRAKIHDSLAKGLRGLSIDVPELPGDRPINRGVVERLIGTLKGWCDTIVGYEGAYRPTDRITESEGRYPQIKLAGQSDRILTKTDIAPEDLPDITEIREQFDRIISRYNETHMHAAFSGLTPGQAYRVHLRRPAERRSGRDLLALIPPVTRTVTTKGVVHSVGYREYRFAYEVDGIMLSVGTRITFRPDPLQRGVFAELRPGVVDFLPPLAVWAEAQDPKDVAKAQRLAAYRAAFEARETRQLADARALGQAVIERGERAADVATAAASSTGDTDGQDKDSADHIGSQSDIDAAFGQPKPLPTFLTKSDYGANRGSRATQTVHDSSAGDGPYAGLSND